MDEVKVNKAFHIGFDRTEDLLKLVPPGTDGEAELVGIAVAVLVDLGERWELTPIQALKHVGSVL